MTLRLGDTAPNFTTNSTDGNFDFYEFLGDSWGVLFSHPADFTPVCTTELGRVAGLKEEFDKRNVKVVGLSVDSVEDHNKWKGDIKDVTGNELNFPLLADEARKVSDLYDMIHPNADSTFTVRTVFVIDPDRKVRLTLTYPPGTGRNFDEILRVIDSLQRTSNHKVATPVDWKPGEEVIIVPSLSDDDAKTAFGNFETVKPYLRRVPDPS